MFWVGFDQSFAFARAIIRRWRRQSAAMGWSRWSGQAVKRRMVDVDARLSRLSTDLWETDHYGFYAQRRADDDPRYVP